MDAPFILQYLFGYYAAALLVLYLFVCLSPSRPACISVYQLSLHPSVNVFPCFSLICLLFSISVHVCSSGHLFFFFTAIHSCTYLCYKLKISYTQVSHNYEFASLQDKKKNPAIVVYLLLLGARNQLDENTVFAPCEDQVLTYVTAPCLTLTMT